MNIKIRLVADFGDARFGLKRRVPIIVIIDVPNNLRE